MTSIRRARSRFRRSRSSSAVESTTARAHAAERTLLDALERRDGDAERVIGRLLFAVERAPRVPAR